MAPPVYSARFAAVQGLDGDFVMEFPPGHVAVFHCFDVYWGGGLSSTDPPPSVRLMGSAGQTIVEFHVTLDRSNPLSEEDSHSWQWQGRQVINEGESATIRVSGRACDVTLSGYWLTTSPGS